MCKGLHASQSVVFSESHVCVELFVTFMHLSPSVRKTSKGRGCFYVVTEKVVMSEKCSITKSLLMIPPQYYQYYIDKIAS